MVVFSIFELTTFFPLIFGQIENMDLLQSTLLSTTLTTALIGLAAYLSRQFIETRLKASVQHEFNAKLEDLRVEHRMSEESFKADLRSKEGQIKSLQMA
jgi:hypothetical protein